ncbi:MAG: protein kinase [Baekduia sp.]
MTDVVIADRYELGDRLGLGGMSTVRAAYDRRLERDVAIKLLADHLAGDEQFVARFKREALAAARLVHPNIVQVFDFGYDRETRHHYIVMERINGPSGAMVLKQRGHLPPDEAVHWIEQACRGLEHAHQHGVVHRDVKPGNLLQSSGDGTVKLADFGIAKAGSEASGLTTAGSVLGTASYLAPEQASGAEAGPQSDLYGLGVVAYQFLAGRLPYEASSLTELVALQQREMPPALHEVDPAIPETLAGAVDRALELDPRDRFMSAGEMRSAIVDGLRGVGSAPTAATRVAGAVTAATTVQPAAVKQREPRRPKPAPSPAPSPVAAETAKPPERRRGRTAPAMLTLALLIAIAAVAFLISRQGAAPQLQDVNRDTAQQTIDAIKQMIEDNVR